MHPYPYYYEKMLQEAYQTLWRQWSEAHQRNVPHQHPSLMQFLVGRLGDFLITFGSWLNKAAHTEIDELDGEEVRQRLRDVKQGSVPL